MKNLFFITVFILLSSCNASQKKEVDIRNLVTKKYFVKGMTCGGCIIGVKIALNQATEFNITDKKIEVGEVILKFEKENYKEEKIDCSITKTIEKVTEFKVFLDKEHTKRACES